MNKCKYCGEEISENARFCPQCGEKQNKITQSPNFQIGEQAAAIIAYISFICFIIALCFGEKDSKFLKFHLNQVLVLRLTGIILLALFSPSTIFFPFNFVLLLPIVILLGICWLIGLISAAQHEIREIPILGKIKFRWF